MGGGTYSVSNRAIRSEFLGYTTKSTQEIFSQREINNAMNPYGISVRESRDSIEHPNSVAIIIALDETGSMGTVPHYLVKEGLPHIMEKIIQNGIADPQVLFLGIGDHECDQAPLQVGQFESSDELLDKWLTDIWLEGRGGGNAGESYLLAWYFAAFHTSIDCWEKRGRKGYCITIGDEPTLKKLPADILKRIMGPGQYQDFTDFELIEKASEMYNVYHINIKETQSGGRQLVYESWKQLLQDNLKVANKREDVVDIISNIVISGEQDNTIIPLKAEVVKPSVEEMIL